MKFIAKAIVVIIANAIGLLISAYFLKGFVLEYNYKQIILMSLVLMILNYTLKPILKLFFGPLIVLTLGLGLIIINAVILYILDIVFSTLTIENIPTLVYASLIIGFINFIFHLADK